MNNIDGQQVSSPIVPHTIKDTYPTHYSIYGNGGHKEVSTIDERDEIPVERLTQGTICYVKETDKEYIYKNKEWKVYTVDTDLSQYATKTYVDSQDLTKADKTYVDSQDATKENKGTCLTADNIIAGNNITLGKSGKNVTINSSGGSSSGETYKLSMRASSTKNTVVLTDSESKESVADIPIASETTLGEIKVGYTENFKNYAVKLNSSNQGYVTVPWTDSGGTAISKFKEYVFKKADSNPGRPSKTGVNYDNPIPSGWSDGIPTTGTGLVWFSTRMFYSDNNNYSEDWTYPGLLADSSELDICYSASEKQPDPPTTHGTQTGDWHNDGASEDIWMAMSTCTNGVWSAWSIVRIKGEQGADGSSIKIVGFYDDSVSKSLTKADTSVISGVVTANITFSDTTHTLADGDCLKITGGTLDGHIMYLSDAASSIWLDLGLIKGDSSYVHIRFSDNGGVDFTGNNGKIPGKYIGIYTDNIEKDSTSVAAYTWTKWAGEDGFGYWYLYTVTESSASFTGPGDTHTSAEEMKNGFTDNAQPEHDWAPSPVAVVKGQYQWMIWIRDNADPLTWSSPVLYNYGVEDGNWYDLSIKNTTPIYYDLNSDAGLNAGSLQLSFTKNGVEYNDCTIKAYDPSNSELTIEVSTIGSKSLPITANSKFKYVSFVVSDSTGTLLTRQYTFPTKSLNGEASTSTGLQIVSDNDLGVIACNSDGSSVAGATETATYKVWYNNVDKTSECTFSFTQEGTSISVQTTAYTATLTNNGTLPNNILVVNSLTKGTTAAVTVNIWVTFNGNKYQKSFKVIRDTDGNVYKLVVSPQNIIDTDFTNGTVITATAVKTYDRSTNSLVYTTIDNPSTEGLSIGNSLNKGTSSITLTADTAKSNIQFYLYEGTSKIDTETVNYISGSIGVQGIEGCVLRNMGGYSSGTTYVNMYGYTPNAGEVRYIDYVLYPTTGDKKYYYLVNPSYGKSQSTDYIAVKGVSPAESSTTSTDAWIQATSMDFAYIQNLIADYIDANTISAQEIVIKRNTDIVAGMTKGVQDQTGKASSNVIMWAGSTTTDTTSDSQVNLKSAPFQVYEDGHTIANEFQTGLDSQSGIKITSAGTFPEEFARNINKAYFFYDSSSYSMNLAVYNTNTKKWMKLNLTSILTDLGTTSHSIGYYTIGKSGTKATLTSNTFYYNSSDPTTIYSNVECTTKASGTYYIQISQLSSNLGDDTTYSVSDLALVSDGSTSEKTLSLDNIALMSQVTISEGIVTNNSKYLILDLDTNNTILVVNENGETISSSNNFDNAIKDDPYIYTYSGTPVLSNRYTLISCDTSQSLDNVLVSATTSVIANSPIFATTLIPDDTNNKTFVLQHDTIELQ